MDIPGPFDYISSNPNKTGHPVGIHLCGHYQSTSYRKMKAKETLSEHLQMWIWMNRDTSIPVN